MVDPRAQAIASHLLSLTQTQGWDTYVTEANELKERLMIQMVQSTKAEFEFIKGQILGIEMVLNIPEWYKNHAK